MARETKAQREQRLAEERAKEQAYREDTYQPRLMLALRRASALGYSLSVQEPQEFVVNPNDREFWLKQARMSLAYDDESYRHLQELECYLDEKEEEKREQERKAQLRKTAIEKLTEEEREVLGL